MSISPLSKNSWKRHLSRKLWLHTRQLSYANGNSVLMPSSKQHRCVTVRHISAQDLSVGRLRIARALKYLQDVNRYNQAGKNRVLSQNWTHASFKFNAYPRIVGAITNFYDWNIQLQNCFWPHMSTLQHPNTELKNMIAVYEVRLWTKVSRSSHCVKRTNIGCFIHSHEMHASISITQSFDLVSDQMRLGWPHIWDTSSPPSNRHCNQNSNDETNLAWENNMWRNSIKTNAFHWHTHWTYNIFCDRSWRLSNTRRFPLLYAMRLVCVKRV